MRAGIVRVERIRRVKDHKRVEGFRKKEVSGVEISFFKPIDKTNRFCNFLKIL